MGLSGKGGVRGAEKGEQKSKRGRRSTPIPFLRMRRMTDLK